jgi:hypothetical protein
MTRDETVALFLQGREAWNAWAAKMLAERKAMEADGRWAAKKNSLGHLVAENDETDGWIKAAAAIFSSCLFRMATGEPANGTKGEEKTVGAAALAVKPVQLDLDSIDFDRFVFPGEAWFENATFTGRASFNGAAFLASARFDGAAFPESAWFNNATFSGYTRFSCSKFSADAWLDSATFAGNAVFENTTFSRNALFGSASFSGSASFNSVKFSGYASFGSATFSGPARFDGATFSGGAWFNCATFLAGARFDGAAFSCNACFDSAAFRNSANFERAAFRKGATFEGIESEGAFNMTGVTFARVPAFGQAEFKRTPDFIAARFPLPLFWREGNPELIFKYRAIRRIAIQGADYRREHMAFKGELRSRRWTVDRWWRPSLWLGIFYDGAGDCGNSIVRPLIAWLAVLAIFPALYLFNAGISPGAWQSACANSPAHVWERAASLSLSNSVPVIVSTRGEETRAFLACTARTAAPDGQPQVDSPLSLSALQFLQTLLSAALIFLFLLAVKNRFKIK